ncbi:MAG: hypothetical protein HKN21_02240 [Candidatus Eisenbacteria bacterium]|uniref:Nucleotidyltransferase family protein n=1 Tax=Eiseniibacteriota bacterium TaxID=2212470 RepID=A0A7Y2H1E2_UNCEI|nr:hypothetical protein [Candidatus Eisenbacteria bacterium]
MKVGARDGLRTVAFKVCTALSEAGVTAVLTGGSAATVYAPKAYQSKDLDFVLQVTTHSGTKAEESLAALGYEADSGTYIHHKNPLTLEFLPYPIAIGSEIIEKWDTLKDNQAGRILHILSPTDSCRDRLAGFLYWNDRSALEQALAVATHQKINQSKVRRWCLSEGQEDKWREFEDYLKSGS